MLSRITLWTLALLFLLQPAAGQEPPDEPISQDDVIRVETNLIQLRAVVTDKQGRPVEGLKREDFEILEDGRAKDIGSFSIDSVGGDNSELTANATSRLVIRATAAARPARSIVLFVDTFHFSTSSFMRVKKQLREIIAEQITDQDLVAIVSTDGRLGALQQFTTDRKTLNFAIEKITLFSRGDSHFTPYLAAKVTSEDREAAKAAVQILVAEESYQPANEEAALSYVRGRAREIINEEVNRRRATLQVLGSVTESLAKMPGQRVVAVLSDGFTMYENGGGIANHETQAVTGRAARSGVVIYSLGAQGLTTPAEFGAASSLTGHSILQVSRYISDSDRDQKEILKALAYDTGGEAYLNTNSLKQSFQNVLDVNSVTYVLGYYAPNVTEDGKFRNIIIRLKTHPEYTVRSARGYVPFADRSAQAAQTPRQRLLLAMLSPLPVTQIAVNSSADFLERASDGAQITLHVNFDGQSVHFEQQGPRYHFQCEVVGAIYDSAGKLVRSFIDSVGGDLSLEQVEVARKTGFRYQTRFEAKPGAYQARVGVRDLGNELIGTTNSWVQVPDLRKGRLTLSSLFLGRDSSTGDKSVSRPKLIQSKPYYRDGDMIFYRFVAYNLDAPADAKLRLEVLERDAPTFASEWQSVAERTITKDKKGIELGGQIRVGLKPGIYTLRATVANHRSKKTAQQTAYFEVER